MRRFGSFVSLLAITQNVIWPGLRHFVPCSFDISLQPGGRMLDTQTKLYAAISAFLNAISKLVSLSLCTPTPFVKNIFVGTSMPGFMTISGSGFNSGFCSGFCSWLFFCSAEISCAIIKILRHQDIIKLYVKIYSESIVFYVHPP